MTNTMTSAEYRRLYQNKRNRLQGDVSEAIIHNHLERLGVENVQKIQVGWGIQRGEGGKVVKTWPLSKVDGDFTGILPDENGRAVLAECKSTSEPKLVHSALRKHQVDALNRHHAANGLALLVWYVDGRIYPMKWPIKGFKKGTSLTEEQAQAALWR